MAEKNAPDAEVVIEDDATVTVDVSDDPTLTAQETEEAEEVVEAKEKPAPKPVTPRVRLTEQKLAAVDEAAVALKEAQAKTEQEVTARRAAEATANSERQRREQAEAVARKASQDREEALTAVESGQLTIIENGIEAATREVAAWETQLADSLEKGDFKAAASAQTKLSTAAADLRAFTREKEAFATRKPPTTEGRVEAPIVSNTTMPFEQYVGQFAPEAQIWLRTHPECVPKYAGGDPLANAKMMLGHETALRQSIAPNTVDYFRVIEEHTGHRAPVSAAAETKVASSEEAEERVAPAPKAKRPAPAAPPSREPPTPAGAPTGQRTVRLSKEQQEVAKMSFPNKPVNEAFALYARNLIELEAEGKLGRTTH